MTDPRLHTVAFSGHRTFKMSGDDLFSPSAGEGRPADTLALRLDRQLERLHREGYDTFLCGMAEGFDLEAAEAVLRLRDRTAGQPARIPHTPGTAPAAATSGSPARSEAAPPAPVPPGMPSRSPEKGESTPGTVRLVAVIPYSRQAAHFSPADRTRYEAVLERADERILLSPVYHAGCFHVRNDYLVDHASLLLCYYNGTQGGTRYTVRRALKAGLPVVNLYP